MNSSSGTLTRHVARYFSHQIEGLENIPKHGGGMVVSPHGLLPIDGLFVGESIQSQCGRTLHGMSHPYFFRVPILKKVLRSRGFVVGVRGKAKSLLAEGHLVHTMPGGVREAFLPSNDGRQLQWQGRLGYLKLAVSQSVPIIPIVTAGIERLYDVREQKWSFTGQVFPGLKTPIPRAFGVGPLPWPLCLPRRSALFSLVGPPIEHGLGVKDLEDPGRLQRAHAHCQSVVLALWQEAEGRC